MAQHRTFGAPPSLERLMVHISAGINTRALYTPNHPLLMRTIQQAIEAVVAACDDRGEDSITFLLVGDELVVDQRPLRKGGLHQQSLVTAFRRRGIGRLTLGRGLDASECHELIEALALGKDLPSTANIVLGQVTMALRDEEGGETVPAPESRPRGGRDAGEGGGARERAEGLSQARIDAAMEAFLRFRSERRAGLGKLQELVWNFMDALSRSTRAVLPVAPLRDHDEYTFVHSVNVSLLVLAHARSFSIEGDVLHSIGLAALLHDVGKLRIPLTILEKPGRLEDDEWKIMMTHSELGAWHLCGLETAAPLSILVAYEHHLRFDGQQNYPVLRTSRRPTLASQLTALADVYDAICTTRPYRKAASREFALDVLRSRAGTFHDPFLVGEFRRLLDAG